MTRRAAWRVRGGDGWERPLPPFQSGAKKAVGASGGLAATGRLPVA